MRGTMRRWKLLLWLWCACSASLPVRCGLAQAADGVLVKLESYNGPASVVAQRVHRHKLRIDVDPKSETNELLVRVELPKVGRHAWPVADVEVRNARGEALVVRRSGIEWHKLLIPVPAVKSSYFVQAVTPPLGIPRPTSEKQRLLTDPATGLTVSLARWHDGRQAALSLRFDDSHPTHLTQAVPILNAYGFRGTFMVNPGVDEPGSRRRSSYQRHRDQWEAVAKSGAHEFANHSAHHRGATGDDEMDAEIGDAARAVRKLNGGRSKLTALNLGGGTTWSTSRTLRYYLDKYHHFDASAGSLGMDDTYGDRVNAFREHLARHIERGLWCKVHFHYIGQGLSSSEENFRAALEIAKSRAASLWIAGMADIHKYQFERASAALSIAKSTARRLDLRLSCQTDPELYDQELTVEVAAQSSGPLDQLAVRDSRGNAIPVRSARNAGQTVFRFDVPPRTADYAIIATRKRSTNHLPAAPRAAAVNGSIGIILPFHLKPTVRESPHSFSLAERTRTESLRGTSRQQLSLEDQSNACPQSLH